ERAPAAGAYPALAIALAREPDGDRLVRPGVRKAHPRRDEPGERTASAHDAAATVEGGRRGHRVQRADLRREPVPGRTEEALVERQVALAAARARGPRDAPAGGNAARTPR